MEARFYLYEGSSTVKVSHTWVYTGYPANKQYAAYDGLKLPENEPVQAFGLRLPLNFETYEPRVMLGQDKGFLVLNEGQAFKMIQRGFDDAAYEVDGSLLEPADQFVGWADVSNANGGVTVSLPYFRENFPKGFRYGSHTLQIDLWPEEAHELDLQTTANAKGPEAYGRGSAFGLAKTHDIFFHFHGQSGEQAKVPEKAFSLMKPVLIRNNPYWLDATGALGRLLPMNPRYGSEEQMLDSLFDWAMRQQINFKWFGMLDFGDTLSWWRNEDGEGWYGEFGWHPVGRWGWYNCEGVGTHTGALLQFVRTGNWKYFEFGSNLARHLMDVDTVHDNTIANDPRLKNVLDDEFSRVGSMHRHNGDHWGGRNEEASHTSVLGILIYYYLTGNERALDVAKEIGEFFLSEPFTYTKHPDVAPHRGMANALWGEVLLYQVTGDPRYKKAADKLIQIYLDGQEIDGGFLENYNPLNNTWHGSKHRLYMNDYALGAFMAYHELTQDEEVKAMLIKLADFLGADPASLHGQAYCYFLTGDEKYIKRIHEGLNQLMANRQQSSDPLVDGLIYKKAIYHRPTTYLYTIPYAFEALEADYAMRRR